MGTKQVQVVEIIAGSGEGYSVGDTSYFDNQTHDYKVIWIEKMQSKWLGIFSVGDIFYRVVFDKLYFIDVYNVVCIRVKYSN